MSKRGTGGTHRRTGSTGCTAMFGLIVLALAMAVLVAVVFAQGVGATDEHRLYFPIVSTEPDSRVEIKDAWLVVDSLDHESFSDLFVLGAVVGDCTFAAIDLDVVDGSVIATVSADGPECNGDGSFFSVAYVPKGLPVFLNGEVVDDIR